MGQGTAEGATSVVPAYKFRLAGSEPASRFVNQAPFAVLRCIYAMKTSDAEALCQETERGGLSGAILPLVAASSHGITRRACWQ